MAVTQIIESDLSHVPNAKTRHIGLGNAWYEIDLTDDEYTQLCEVMKPYLSVARPDSRPSAAWTRCPTSAFQPYRGGPHHHSRATRRDPILGP